MKVKGKADSAVAKNTKVNDVATDSADAKGVAAKKSSKKAVDIAFLKSITGDDVSFEKELFILFLDSAKNNILKMEKALAESDNDGWYMASHALKGASASIGAFDLSKELEYAQTHPKDDYKDKVRVLADIKAELAKVSLFINEDFLKSA
jgi:HPt (histidine-containing phosphotransfer) domain-containing protein